MLVSFLKELTPMNNYPQNHESEGACTIDVADGDQGEIVLNR